MPEDQQLTFVSGSLKVVLSPSIGGSIRGLYWAGADGLQRPVLRECHSSDPNVLDMASFPLVPYVNRIRGGTFEFRGRRITIQPNMSGDVSPLHGQGWLSSWRVESADERRAVLCFAHRPDEWPWAYEARQQFDLDEQGLTVTLTCTNSGDEAMPCGLGQHPYFPCGPETCLDTGVKTVWTIDEHVLPVAEVPATGRFDLHRRLVCGQGLDHGFGGWSGTAHMADPAWPYELQLSSSDAGFFQLYSPSNGGIFVAEPVTHANAALNAPEEEWPALGLQVLEPGDTATLAMRLDVKPL